MRNSISFIVLGALVSLHSVQATAVEKTVMSGFDEIKSTVDNTPSGKDADDTETTENTSGNSLFVAYDEKAIAAKPSEKTAEGYNNIIHRLEQVNRQTTQSSSAAVKKSRAVQRAVSYKVRGKRYTTLADSDGFVQTGRASWYGKRFHGRKTASGERFDMNALTAAHKELPLGTKIEVTNNENGKKIVVTVNDRGPFHGNRVLDLSRAAARELGVIQQGTANVTIRAL